MIFHRGKKSVCQIPAIMLENPVLEWAQLALFLGITITKNLRWDWHIQKVSGKTNELCGILYLHILR